MAQEEKDDGNDVASTTTNDNDDGTTSATTTTNDGDTGSGEGDTPGEAVESSTADAQN